MRLSACIHVYNFNEMVDDEAAYGRLLAHNTLPSVPQWSLLLSRLTHTARLPEPQQVGVGVPHRTMEHGSVGTSCSAAEFRAASATKVQGPRAAEGLPRQNSRAERRVSGSSSSPWMPQLILVPEVLTLGPKLVPVLNQGMYELTA